MTGRLTGRTAKLSAALLIAVTALIITAASASAMLVYNNLPKKLPPNVPSIGFEATSTSQFGSLVELSKSRRGRRNPKVTFALSDWACQSGGGESCVSAKKSSYTWPVTVNLYNGTGNALGSLIATKTQSVTVPYRPSASAECAAKEAPGAWYDKKSKECFNGFLFKVAYEFPGVTLPDSAVVGIAYDTQNYGAEPTGVSGPENSLNVGISSATPTNGANPLPDDVFVNSSWSEMYCEGATDIGTFGDSGACWEGYEPLLSVKTEK
jgi:hypothetical protein